MTEEPNLTYIKNLAGGDSAFEKKFIGILQTEFPIEKKEYLGNIAEDMTREAALNVHKLKHKFNILGLEESYRLAVTYEEDLRTGNTALKNEFHSILETIEVYLKTI
ncbi:Hpt domain-containing protein [Spongiimicrobium salis]|uniref:Hpt domain-containing protein n=1 Tax=Spongiimicrobium salis TaxID=1667022 RepID=UPI00374DB817